jgi:hypothetical protein
VSRHGSGKRRRTSPDPDDTGSGGSGEYAAHGSEPYEPTEHEPTSYEQPAPNAPPYDPQYDAAGYDPAQYDSGTYEAQHPYESDSYEAIAYGASAYDPDRDATDAGHTAEFGAPVHDGAEPTESAGDERVAARAPEPEPEPDTGMRPPPPPLEGDIVKLVAAGSLIWFALFVVAWFMRDSLTEDGHEWWPWCALAGSGLGLLGLWYVRRLRDARED